MDDSLYFSEQHLAVRNMAVPDSSLITRRVASYRFVVCGAPSYFAKRGTPETPADLARHNCLIYSRSAWGDQWRFTRPDGGEQSISVKGNLHANSDNALRLAAVNGQGLAMVPSFLVKDEIKSGRFIPVGGIMPARSLRTTFSHASAFWGTFSTSILSSIRPAVFNFSLWQVTQ